MAPIDNGGGALLGMANWVEGLIYSPAAVAIAVLAIAATGLSMLTGRLPVKRGLVVTLGCFTLFGAPAIARGVIASTMAISGQEATTNTQPMSPPTLELVAPPPPAQVAVDDPYAGAAVRN